MTQQILEEVKQLIETEIFKHLQKNNTFDVEHHTHPPLRFLVKSCAYCTKYGNEYCN